VWLRCEPVEHHRYDAQTPSPRHVLRAPDSVVRRDAGAPKRPNARNGEVVIRPMMYVALSYDHRLVDGSEAVRFLVRVKELVEDPTTLLLEG
jgi:2-oxoglutarate dehydrogenase E2 component (dihydrolipoamide succinyltransferase)